MDSYAKPQLGLTVMFFLAMVGCFLLAWFIRWKPFVRYNLNSDIPSVVLEHRKVLVLHHVSRTYLIGCLAPLFLLFLGDPKALLKSWGVACFIFSIFFASWFSRSRMARTLAELIEPYVVTIRK